ncbi:dimethylarginine dimethylaminohydrolase family protein [Aestuariispira insulae]|uniref:Dimethylargininase n=1 Tax=Aestuariispira insulae TaxID=1461337 RepID=A0A3D9HWD8_9PROT|nr:dimethylarginine dimethylaminohydrolase [Aestuariispira insulae]RED53787.1 dimethylargininase [Aestuariispira insulae]
MSQQGRSYQFTNAICRVPAHSIIDGLRAEDTGTPSPDQFRSDHGLYIAALEKAGIEVEVLPALEEFPDSVFVEDPALCLPDLAVVLRPGAESREGEAQAIRPALETYYDTILTIEDGFVDGGDILMTDDSILVGLSARTNQAGFEELKGKLATHGHKVEKVDTPEGVLHFKTDCSLLDSSTILATYRLKDAACFSGFKVLEVPRGEETAANSIRVNDRVIVSQGFPKTAQMLEDAGYRVEIVPTQQAALVDGGPSCMSLRFAPNK